MNGFWNGYERNLCSRLGEHLEYWVQVAWSERPEQENEERECNQSDKRFNVSHLLVLHASNNVATMIVNGERLVMSVNDGHVGILTDHTHVENLMS